MPRRRYTLACQMPLERMRTPDSSWPCSMDGPPLSGLAALEMQPLYKKCVKYRADIKG